MTCKSFYDRSYPIVFDWNLIDHVQELCTRYHLRPPFYIISDKTVWKHHGERLLKAITPHPAFSLLVRPGETSKSLSNWRKVQEFLLQNGADRRSTVIAFGGGVVGDLAGFSASTYMRGLNFIQIPTTLLSQSDSSIGAKVAVNHPAAKNLIGSFYQPHLVITDPSLLATLSPREFSAGLGEAIKYGVIEDPDLFERLYRSVEDLLSYNQEFLGDLIARCIRIKVRVVEEDERETGLRKILNFGHTIGHALEQATHYRRLRHGEAVAWGMLAAGWIAIDHGMWDPAEFEKLKSIIFRAGSLYPMGDITPADVLEALKHDKKKTGKSLNFVLPERTGKVTIVSDVSHEQVMNAIEFIFQLEPAHR